MKNATTVTTKLGEYSINIETGVLAGQADGSVVVTMGDNVLFCAISTSREPRPGIDFFPLQVEYREKFYCAGQFPGGYFKREARPSEKEILTMRVTDRPLRPLFPKGFCRDVQINNLVMSCDGNTDTDILSVNAASTALVISELPFNGPLGAVRVGRIDGKFIALPTHEEVLKSDINLIYAGTAEKTMMIEGEADEISEADLIAAMKFGHEAIQPIIKAQLELRAKLGLGEKEPFVAVEPTEVINKVKELAGNSLHEVMLIGDKKQRGEGIRRVRDELNEKLLAVMPDVEEEDFSKAFYKLEINAVRENVLEHGKRIDGRQLEAMRPLTSEVSVLPRTHGSSVFARGETQSLCTVTLAATSEAQNIDGVTGGPKEKNFILHYNFPPYSVGEAGRLGATSRREIGHGNLAERSLARMVDQTEFPYAIRIVSEIMSSNGSTSMASVSGGCLALMDAGVPMRRPVAGISVGLFTAPGKSLQVLDILGTEDHCGDMDFKVCGSSKGITGWQVDMKIHGLDWAQLEYAFELARKGRLEILDHMAETLSGPREDISQYAPRTQVLEIDPEKIGALIGPGGKNIRSITDNLDVQIDIEDDGRITLYSSKAEIMEAAINEVKKFTMEAEPGVLYKGIVRSIKPFGAFVEVLPGKDGLVHISELAEERVERVEDFLEVGQKVTVKCLDVDDNGKIRLSLKAAIADLEEAEG